MPGRDPHDHWDDEEEVARHYQDDDGYEREREARSGPRRRRDGPYYADRGYGSPPRMSPRTSATSPIT